LSSHLHSNHPSDDSSNHLEVLIDKWNVISEAGKAEVKQESIEAKGHNSDYRTKGERETDHVL